MTQKRIFKITGARCTEDARYCEPLGELFEKLEDGEIEAECDLSDELLDKIHKILTFLSTMHDTVISLPDDGLSFDDEAILGEFRTDAMGKVNVWLGVSGPNMEWEIEHKHSGTAKVFLEITEAKGA